MAVDPPKRGMCLQASRGSKKTLHLVMCSPRPSCESSNCTKNLGRNTQAWEKKMTEMIAGGLVLAISISMTVGITVIMFMAGRRAVRK